MKRSDFFRHGFVAGLGIGILPALPACTSALNLNNPGKAKNIIFLVSDGMSSSTLAMADQLLHRKEGRGTNWLNLYREGKANRALMDMASLNAIVTDSAAASSSWGSGHRVNNGAVNMGPNGEAYTTILQKFKKAGKAVGCVTSVPITHATPSGFCIATPARGDQSKIAELYLSERFDVMFGAGFEHFSADRRTDQRDLFMEFRNSGYSVVQDLSSMTALTSIDNPCMGVFIESSLPYAIDHRTNAAEFSAVPTLAQMTDHALRLLSSKPEGFAIQIEGGKVDWAAHDNDAAGLIYDQLAFDEAVGVALAFAEGRDDTLVIITTDHGNANPALMYGSDTNEQFDLIHTFKHSNEWILSELNEQSSVDQIRERIEFATGIGIDAKYAQILKSSLTGTYEAIYTRMSNAPEVLGAILSNYTKVGFIGDGHTSDYVELAMVGAGSEELPAFMKNTDLHTYMLQVAGVVHTE